MQKKIKLFTLLSSVLLSSTLFAAHHGKLLDAQEVLEKNSPWVTTAIYMVNDNKVNQSKNYISDTEISKNTISSAQYSHGKFIFVPVDYKNGMFPEKPVKDLVKNAGKYELLEEDGDIVRRVFETNFKYTHKRKIVTINADEFTYQFEKDGNVYHVLHKPYAKQFPDMKYPAKLTKKVDEVLAK